MLICLCFVAERAICHAQAIDVNDSFQGSEVEPYAPLKLQISLRMRLRILHGRSRLE